MRFLPRCAIESLMIACVLLGTAVAGPPLLSPAGQEVDTILLLAVDISQSMDEDEQRAQRAGYVAAIGSTDFIAAVRQGALGKIAIAYVEWSGQSEQFVVVPWTVIAEPADAQRLAEDLENIPVKQSQRTSISAALMFAGEMIDRSGFSAGRRVVDVSGDGPNNQGGPVAAARDSLVARGIVINGLPLMLKADIFEPSLDLAAYYEGCVIGGPGSFVVPVRGVQGFAEAIHRKLISEIAGLEPMLVLAGAREPVNCGAQER